MKASQLFSGVFRTCLMVLPVFLLIFLGWHAGVTYAQPTQVGEIELIRIETPSVYPLAREGEPGWRYIIHRPEASYIAVHFERFDLSPGDQLVISDPNGIRQVAYTNRGKDGRGTFWATHIPGDTAILELFGAGEIPGSGFMIDKISHGYPAANLPGSSVPSGPQAICGVDDSTWAQCYQTSESGAYEHGRSVARLLLHKTDGDYVCTGWLLGSEGHLITNNHCIANSTEANDTDYEFMAEGSCSTDCSAWFSCPGNVIASSATFVKTSDQCNLDYALVKLPVDPSPTYGYLTVRNNGASDGERIYIIGHPDGEGKRISLESTNANDPDGFCSVYSLSENRCDPSGTCDALGGPQEVGYMCDTRGGSSGSPVLGYSDHQVVALHHCANCPNRGERIQDVVTDMGTDLPLSAVATGDKFGASVATCDFNGDGIGDIAIGVPDEDIGTIKDAGFVNVLYGSAAGGLQVISPPDQGWSQDIPADVEGGAEAGDRFGSALAAGYFNSDNYCDLAIGVPGESIGSIEDAGYVNVIYGSAAGLQTTSPADQGWSQDIPVDVEGGAEMGDSFGSALAAGDFNSDGYDDLAVGVPGESIGSIENAGFVNIIYGSATGLQTTSPADQGWSQNTTNIEGVSETGDRFGSALATGDFNPDGYDDLAVGVPGESIGSIGEAGHVNVIYGSAAGLQTTSPADQGWSQDTPGIEGVSEMDDHFGRALAAGDFDGDGYTDLAIGAPEEDIGLVADAGAVNIIYGTAVGGLTSTDDQLWSQDTSGITGIVEQGDGLGSILASGDFDNDGYADLAIGVPEEDYGTTADSGYVNVIYGSVTGLTSAGNQGWGQYLSTIIGNNEKGDHFGHALAAGDFNGDGYVDMAAGVPGEDIGTIVDSGHVNVIYGTSTGLSSSNDEGWSQDSSGVDGMPE